MAPPANRVEPGELWTYQLRICHGGTCGPIPRLEEGCFSESPGEGPEVRLVRRDRACRRVSICTERYAEAVHAPDVRLYIA